VGNLSSEIQIDRSVVMPRDASSEGPKEETEHPKLIVFDLDYTLYLTFLLLR